jgi:hypothetical protein
MNVGLIAVEALEALAIQRIGLSAFAALDRLSTSRIL